MNSTTIKNQHTTKKIYWHTVPWTTWSVVKKSQKIEFQIYQHIPDLDERHPPHPRIPGIDDGISNNIDRGLMALLTFLHRFYKVVAISYISSIFRVLRVPFEAHLHYVDQALFGRFSGEWRLHSGFTFFKIFPRVLGKILSSFFKYNFA